MKKLIPIILSIVTAFSLLMPVQAKKDDSALPDDNKIDVYKRQPFLLPLVYRESYGLRN